MHYFSNLSLIKNSYMFRTDLLSIIRSLNDVYTAIGICHASYVEREWRKLHNEEQNGLYSLPNIVRVIKSRRMRWAGHVARMGEERGVYRVLVGKPEGERPLGRSMRRWEDNVRMDLREVGCGCEDWIGLAQDKDTWGTLVSV
jgi:hypothetical protein